MRRSSAANNAASSPPVPARTSRMALRASSTSFGISASLTCASSAGRRSRKVCSSSSASAFSSGSSPDWEISTSEASSSRARWSASIPSTIGLSSLYSFDNLAKSAPVSWLPPRVSRSSAWRRRSCSKCASRDGSTAAPSSEKDLLVGQRFESRRQFGKGDFCLLPAAEIAQRRHASCQLVFAQQYGSKRVDPIGPPQPARQVAGISEIDRKTAGAEILGELQRSGFTDLADRYQRDRARWRWRCGDQHRESLDTGRPADPGQRRSAHQLDQPVISTATHHGALRAEVGSDELKRRVCVIVEPSHEPRVRPITYAQPIEPRTDLVKEMARLGIEVIAKGRRIPHDYLISFLLRIEYAQWVTLEPTPAVLRQFGGPRREIGDERFAVGSTAFGIAQRVELEHDTLTYPEHVENSAAQRDHLDVGLRLGRADQLDPHLVKLAEPAFLRSLIAEHWAAVEEFEGQALGEAVGDYRANHPGSVFWPQRDFLTAAVVEGVHLLRYDVGVLADRSRENLGELENRRRHFGEAVEFGRTPRGLDHPAVPPRHLGKKILSTADRLQGTHARSPDRSPQRTGRCRSSTPSVACRRALQALAECRLRLCPLGGRGRGPSRGL